MFKKEERLTKDKEFDKVFKKGRSAYDQSLGVRAVKNDLNINRFGILVSTKVSKKAVVRNKLKRQIREILKNIKPEIKGFFDIVVITLPSAVEQDYKSLEDSVELNFKKLKLIK